jgi:hypothetical protein
MGAVKVRVTKRNKPMLPYKVTPVPGGSGIGFDLPIQLVSEINMHEHWAVRHRRKKAQQMQVGMLVPAHLVKKLPRPLDVVFTRHGGRKMDSDNIHTCTKHVRDELARILGVNDGDDSAVRWFTVWKPGPLTGMSIELSSRKCNPM